MKTIISILVASTILMYAITSSYAELIVDDNNIVKLSGKLMLRGYTNPDNKIENVYILLLRKGIDIEEQKGEGPVNNLTKIQVIFIPSKFSIKSIDSKYLNKNVTIMGTLLYAGSPHHYTPALINAKEILLDKKR